MKKPLLFVIALTLLCGAETAEATLCDSIGTPELKFQTAFAIFRGRVTSVTSVEAPEVSYTPPEWRALHQTTFEIEEVWKGAVQNTENVLHLSLHQEDRAYEIGSSWVIYAKLTRIGPSFFPPFLKLVRIGEIYLTGDGSCGYGSWPLAGNWLNPQWNEDLADLQKRASKIFVPGVGFVDKK